MTYLTPFTEGDYAAEVAALEQRRNDVTKKAEQHAPANLKELLASNEDGELWHNLAPKNIPDPRSSSDGEIKVYTSLICVEDKQGEEDGKRDADPYVTAIELIGKLPNGENRIIGRLDFFGGQHEPYLFLNTDFDPQFATSPTSWNSADAILFLDMAEAYFKKLEGEG